LSEAFYLYPKYLIHLVYFKESKRSHNQSSKIFQTVPKEISDLFGLYLDSILPALYKAGSNGLLKKYDEKKREEKIPSPFGLNISKTMLIFISEMISLGIIKSSHDVTNKISELILGYLQKESKRQMI
jgi:hypothetical protein